MPRLTPREIEIMTVLWEQRPITVAEVRDALGDDSAYTTILTLLRVLEAKGRVAREAEARAHRCGPLIDRDEASSNAVDRVLGQFFRGAPERLALATTECGYRPAALLAPIRILKYPAVQQLSAL